MEDKELSELQDEEKRLEVKIAALIQQLKNKEPDKHQISNLCECFVRKELYRQQYEQYLPKQHDNDVISKKLLKVLESFTGIKFTNVTRKWISHNSYKYQATVASKAIPFSMDLIVQQKDQNDFEINDLTCHFHHVDKCVLLEMEAWIHKLTKMKNVSLLLSAVSDYSEKMIIRSKILSKIQEDHCGYIKECIVDDIGISIFLHPPSNSKEVYLIMQWTLTFCEWTLYITHSITIKITESGKNFAEENRSLLKQFSSSFDEGELILLWEKLYLNIYDYKTKKSK